MKKELLKNMKASKKVKMRSNSGITIIMLVITLVVMLILGTFTFGISFNIKQKSNILSFINEITMVETKIFILIYEAGDDTTYSFPGIELTSANAMTINGRAYPGTGNTTGTWYYLTSDLIKNKLGLEKINGTYIVNYETEQVISVEGVEYEDVMYYTFETAADAIDLDY